MFLRRPHSLSRSQTKKQGQILVSECIKPDQSGFDGHYFLYVYMELKTAGAERGVNRILLLFLCRIISLRASGQALTAAAKAL